MSASSVRRVIHVDMDAFYASVEQRDNPTLKGRPVIVGGDPQGRGVVCAASYEARRLGVFSAMPMRQAMRRCPQAVILPVRMGRYAEVSRRIHAIMADYTPLIEPLSLDEAFLDVTGSIPLLGPDILIGREIKQRIKAELKLVASVGVAPNKFLAKVGSDLEKPSGFVVITEQNKQAVLDPLPVKRIWGVGKVTQQTLASRGIETVRQLRQMPFERLEATLGAAAASSLYRLARGQDDRAVEPEQEAKSLSSERTFATDMTNRVHIEGVLLEEVERVAARLRRQQLYARTVMVKIRYGDFRTITRRTTLAQSTCLTERLWEAARSLLIAWQKTAFGPVRLIGFGVTGLAAEKGRQLELFPDPQEQRLRRLDRVIDEVRDRFGAEALQRGHEG